MVEEIRKHALFRSLGSDELRQLIEQGEIVRRFFPRGRTIHEQGKICKEIHLLCSGKVVAYSPSINGSETIVFELNPPDIVGANVLFGEQNRYPMNVFCLSDCHVICASKKAVLHLLSNYEFTLAFVKAISLNAQKMNQKLAIYTRGSLRENLMDYLTALVAEQNTSSVFLPMTKKQLADYFGVQRPSLFRELKRMKDEGLIQINNRVITIL